MATTPSNETTFTVRRLNVAVPDVRGFQRSYEAAVPEVPQEQVSTPWCTGVRLRCVSDGQPRDRRAHVPA